MKNPFAPHKIKDTTRINHLWDGRTLEEIDRQLQQYKANVGVDQFNATRLKVSRTGEIYTLFTFKRLERFREILARFRNMKKQGHLTTEFPEEIPIDNGSTI